jgi:hypothetical protein
MDTTVFIEYLPSNKQWFSVRISNPINDVGQILDHYLTPFIAWLAAWWGLGQAIAGFIAWGFLSELEIFSGK